MDFTLKIICVIAIATCSVISFDLCRENFHCMPLRDCNPSDDGTIIYPCHKGLNLVCCPLNEYQNTTSEEIVNRKTGLFPVNCGVILSGNKITGGKTADLGQFPWMALIGYKQKSVSFVEFLCGGTVITDNYVLTAAHCISLDPRRKLVSVRLGEHNLKTSTDCVTIRGKQTCSDPTLDIPVQKIISHEGFGSVTLKNDIALIKTAKKITFSDYIQPICMPFERNIENKNLTGERFTISGWGKTNAKNLGGSPELQYADVNVWDQKRCNSILPPVVRNISDSQLCAIGKVEDACRGDSGGPMINATTDLDGEVRYFQIGIVSFAPTKTCGIEELPPVYTRVDKYLKWILDKID